MIRCFFILHILLILVNPSLSQNKLYNSTHGSAFRYYYRISPEKAWQLFSTKMKAFRESELGSPVDSILSSDPDDPKLPYGNYIKAGIKENLLIAELITVGDLKLKLLSNDHDLLVYLHNRQGNSIPDAAIDINGKKIPFDKEADLYRVFKNRKKGWVRIKYQNQVFCYLAEKKVSNGYKYNKRRNSQYRSPDLPDDQYRGYLALSKPKFKPLDTVFFKGFVTTKKGKFIARPLLLRLSNYSIDLDTVLALVKPYRKGGYHGYFTLNDSLDLDLDTRYTLTLEEQESRKYDLHKYNGPLDDREYLSKRKVLASNKFGYEEYELKSIRFDGRLSKKMHGRQEQQSLFLKAMDENELALPDARIKLLVKPSPGSELKFEGTRQFLPDTLWQWEQPLDPVGETRINLPETIFAGIGCNYIVTVDFYNSSNEHQQKSFYGQYTLDSLRLEMDTRNDSLLLRCWKAGVSVQQQGLLTMLNNQADTVEQKTILLPAVLPIHPFVSEYYLETAGQKIYFDAHEKQRPVKVISSRNSDSVFFRISNPQKIKCWYTIFKKNRIIEKGSGYELDFKSRSTTKEKYSLSLQYIYGDQPVHEEYPLAWYDKQLAVGINQPALVYPGQKVAVEIIVNDAEGRPVPGADVTAFAYTSKFNNPVPADVPYLGHLWKDRKIFKPVNLVEAPLSKKEKVIDWSTWRIKAGLDSIVYYHFLFPEKIFEFAYYIADSLTQLSPFVVRNGAVQPVHQLFIDNQPVYFSQTQEQPYSFPVRPGYHTIEMRTSYYNISIDSILVKKGTKHILSVNADSLNDRVNWASRPDTLSRAEQDYWSSRLIMVNNNFLGKMATISQGDRLIWLNPELGRSVYQYNYNSILTGPFRNGEVELNVRENYRQDFLPEGGYFFSIHPQLIKQKELRKPFFSIRPAVSYRSNMYMDTALTEKQLDEKWDDILNMRNQRTDNQFRSGKTLTISFGQLRFGLEKAIDIKAIRNVLLFRYDMPNFLKIYPGSTRNLEQQYEGMYRIMLLYKKDSYILLDSVTVKPHGINFYQVSLKGLKSSDTLSRFIWQEMRSLLSNPWQKQEQLLRIQQEFNERYMDTAMFSQVITGLLINSKGDPIPYGTIKIKGTRIGTVTDQHGFFRLSANNNCILQASAVGYMTQELDIPFTGSITMVMQDEIFAMSEVVVTALGVQRQARELGYSVSSIKGNELSGRVAGLTIETSGNRIVLRGARSLTMDNTALVLLDGVPVPANTLDQLDPNSIASVEVLKGEDATGIYGPAGANGVLMITTLKGLLKKQEEQRMPKGNNSLRQRFRDDAYWQPALRTDAEGKATFNVTYPDDITSWKNFALVMADKKRTGSATTTVKSFLELSAQLAIPHFAIEGDLIRPIAKSMNYGDKLQELKRSFYYNGELQLSGQIRFMNAWIDTLQVKTADRDSLVLKYTIEKTDGYFDGEEKKIPVYKKGTLETNGIFAALYRDSSFSFQLPAGNDPLYVRAEASSLPVLYEETEIIRNYEYLCNEQLASKLIALLLQKKIRKLQKEEFRNEKAIRELLELLMKNKHASGFWGWWDQTDPMGWISLHVIGALSMAEQAGYTINWNKTSMIDQLRFQLTEKVKVDEINTIRTLFLLDPKIELRAAIDSAARHNRHEDLYHRLRIIELKQLAGMDNALPDSLIAQHKNTLFGNIYWGDEGIRFFDNSIQNSLLMYRLLRKDRPADDRLLEKLRGYFLEQRKTGGWRNTYESSLILETLLPDMIALDYKGKPAELKLDGAMKVTINHFPFETKIHSTEKITVDKKGLQPVYFTAYRKSWNHEPAAKEQGFEVRTHFERNGKRIDSLKAGEQVILVADVELKGDGSYIMIEIPIPAGCSYESKPTYGGYNEIHREYFKNKLAIFCSELKQGRYRFQVDLMPRYSGLYTLNPAKAELMYFPTFFGREGVKMVGIR